MTCSCTYRGSTILPKLIFIEFQWPQEGNSSQEDEAPERREPGPAVAPRIRRAEPPAGPSPLLQEAPDGSSGGVQGLRWYADSMLQDADGDCAHEFLEESASSRRLRGEGGPTAAKQQRRQVSLTKAGGGAATPQGRGIVVLAAGGSVGLLPIDRHR
jgi:hypothetical protein